MTRTRGFYLISSQKAAHSKDPDLSSSSDVELTSESVSMTCLHSSYFGSLIIYNQCTQDATREYQHVKHARGMSRTVSSTFNRGET